MGEPACLSGAVLGDNSPPLVDLGPWWNCVEMRSLLCPDPRHPNPSTSLLNGGQTNYQVSLRHGRIHSLQLTSDITNSVVYSTSLTNPRSLLGGAVPD